MKITADEAKATVYLIGGALALWAVWTLYKVAKGAAQSVSDTASAVGNAVSNTVGAVGGAVSGGYAAVIDTTSNAMLSTSNAVSGGYAAVIDNVSDAMLWTDHAFAETRQVVSAPQSPSPDDRTSGMSANNVPVSTSPEDAEQYVGRGNFVGPL